MFTATIYVAICSGWLCKEVHGEESAFPLKTEHKTIEECLGDADLVARWVIGDKLKYRIDCRKI